MWGPLGLIGREGNLLIPIPSRPGSSQPGDGSTWDDLVAWQFDHSAGLSKNLLFLPPLLAFAVTMVGFAVTWCHLPDTAHCCGAGDLEQQDQTHA